MMYFAGKCYLLRKLKVMGPTIFLITEKKKVVRQLIFSSFRATGRDLKNVKDKEHNNR